MMEWTLRLRQGKRGRNVVDPKTETRIGRENRGHLSAIMEQAEEEEAEELQHGF
jgi:hypothetical protein